MAELLFEAERMVVARLRIAVERDLQVASLRSFTREGAFAAALRKATGLSLPGVLQAVEAPQAELILGWRSPTETLCLSWSTARLAQLRAGLSGIADGCLVELTGGIRGVRVTGERTGELLCRLGGTTAMPQPGECRRGRLAEVPVVALSLRTDEVLLLLERVYLQHVLTWIRETLLEFDAA